MGEKAFHPGLIARAVVLKTQDRRRLLVRLKLSEQRIRGIPVHLFQMIGRFPRQGRALS